MNIADDVMNGTNLSVSGLRLKGRQLADTKWRDFMEGLDDDWEQVCTALLLENQFQYFVQKKMEMYDLTEEQVLQEATTMTTPGIATFEKYAFPMIRAIYPNLIATQLVSVQPMTGPASIIFYLGFTYGTSKGTSAAGSDIWENPDYRYSSEEISGEVLGTGDGAVTTFTDLVCTFSPVRPNTVSITDGVETFTDNGNGTLTGSLGGTGTIVYSSGAITTITFNTAPTDGTNMEADYEYNMEANTQIPEVDLVLTSSPVVARPRKLRSRWSMEAAANLRTVHGLDAETELSAVLAEELKFEIDREIISHLDRIASAGVVSFSKTVPSGISVKDHYASFVHKMVEVGNLIFRATRRAQANWIVAGTDVCNIIETLEGFVPSGLGGTMGVINIGTLNGRWRCFKDPYFPKGKFLVGYKGGSFLETGYVYAPYIPMFVTPTVTLDDFVVRKGIGTLYGKKVVNPKFYGTGVVVN